MNEGATSPTLPGIEPEHAWLAETVRLTVFPSAGTTLRSRSWEEVFGVAPDQIIRQPMGPHLEGGPIDGARWVINRQPDRFDVAVVPENPTSAPSDLLNVGDFQSSIDRLLERYEMLFEAGASIQRLAVGGILFMSVDSMRDGIRTLQTVVPQLRGIPENATDIAFQLNLPYAAGELVQDLSINRLLKWQVTSVHLLGVGVGPGGPFQIASTVKRTVIRMEIDINTPVDRITPLPSDKIFEIIKKLGAIAKKSYKPGGLSI